MARNSGLDHDVGSLKMAQKTINRASGDQSPETPAEMAERVHQVISVIADAVLKLAYERFGSDFGKLEGKKRKSKDEPIDTGQR